MPHNVCVCSIHENMLMCVSVLAKKGDFPSTCRPLVNIVVCDRANQKCMHMLDIQCSDCQSVKDFYLVNIDNVDTQVAWFQWETIDRKVQKIKHEGTIAELIDCLAKQWNTFLAHCYVKDVQSSYYEKLKRKLGPNESVVQVDFSENYQTFHQDET